MAVLIGTNSGFVEVAPTADPAGLNGQADNTALVTRDTSPATAIKITEVGWYCDNATEEANFEIGLYAADGAVVPGEAGTLLYSSIVNAKGTEAGWKSVAVDWDIDPNTAYWLGLQLEDTATQTNTNYGTATGSGRDARSTMTSLPDPFGGGALLDAGGMMAIYAVWTATSTYTVTYNGNGNTSGTAPTDASSPYEEAAEVTVLGNTGNLVKSGYVWNGWNTLADGTGTHYDATDTFNMPASNIILYAEWLVNVVVMTNPKYGIFENRIFIEG